MKYEIDFLQDKKIVVVKMEGRLNFQIAEQYSREAVKLARQNECTKFLIDHTETLLNGKINKIHASGEELQQFGFFNSDRIAFVIPHPDNDPNALDLVTQNSRWCVLKYFSSVKISEAYKWLLEVE